MYNFILAGESTGIGKSTITTALLMAFDKVQSFKAGPDYIDPKLHEYVTGRSSYNLDPYMLGEKELKYLFAKHSINIGVNVVEGVMGLYDGMGYGKNNYSTAHLSKILNLPVILVVDGSKIANSLFAKIYGYINYDKDVNIVGLIINNTSEKMYEFFKEEIEREFGINVYGWFPKDDNLKFESRHLGLKSPEENKSINEKLLLLKNYAQNNIDLEKIKKDTKSNKTLLNPYEHSFNLKGKKVAIALDEAFNFYYKDNLELLEELGCKIEYFSPIRDKKLPRNIDLLYIGGGYPELYLKELEGNKELLEDIKAYAENNGRIYGECGGFMYLTREIKDVEGKSYKMLNLLPSSIEMTPRLNIGRFGYIKIENENIHIRAHEFHYSKNIDDKDTNYIFNIKKENKNKNWLCGLKEKSVLGTYAHIHFYSNINYIKFLFNF